MKSLSTNVDDEFYRQVKIHIATLGMKINEYLVGLIQKDLEKQEKGE